MQFVEEENIYQVTEIKKSHILSYQNHCAIYLNLSSSTLNKRIVVVKSFFKFLSKTDKIYINPSLEVPLPKRRKTLPRNILEVWEVEQLLRQPDLTTDLGARDRAILELFYGVGIRNEELRSIKVSDIDLRAKRLMVTGKGNKEAYLPLGEKAYQYMESYFLFNRPRLLQMNTGAPKKTTSESRDYFFLSKNGFKFTSSNVWSMIKRYEKLSELDKPVTAHGLRHSCATHLLRNGADIRLIQKLLRHEDLGTTQIYTKVDVLDLQEAQRKYHPRELNND